MKEKDEKNKQNDTNKNFFEKFYNSIVKIEKYPEMSAEGFPRAILYFTILVVIFSVISCLGTIYQLNKALKQATNYLENDCPDFSYNEGYLTIDEEQQPIRIENGEQFGKIIIDTNEEDEEKINQYTKEITEVGNGAVILKDKIILKTESVMGTTNYVYNEIFNQIGINFFDKSMIVDFINSSKVFSLYSSLFLMLFIYTFVIYFINLISYVVFISIFGIITNLFSRLKMRYVAIFNMAVYATTLSTVLFMIYVAINTFVPFTIKYFEPMYISVATIYLIAAILILKSDAIKKQIELAKIIEVQKQVKQQMKNDEEKSNDEKDKNEKEEKESEKSDNEQKNKKNNEQPGKKQVETYEN